MTTTPDQRPSRRWRRILILLLLGGVGVGGLYVYDYCQWPERFAVLEPGKLYRSSQPSTRQIQHLIDKVGLRTILIVRSGSSSRVPDEVDFAKAKGLNVVHIPVESEQPIPEAQVRQFFQYVDDAKNHPILIHCSAGRHRTGYMCARYRIERQGWTLQKAIDEMLTFGFDTKDQGVVLNQLKAYKGAAENVVVTSSQAKAVGS